MRFWRRPKDVIPNPRESKRRRLYMQGIKRDILACTQFFVFAMALILLLLVTAHAPV